MAKTLIITGGSSGIGKAAANIFSQKGYKVYELSRHGENAENITHIDCDVTKPEDCKKAVSQVIEETGHIDVMISNAGMGISGAIEFTEISDAKRQIDVNFFGALNITQAVLPYMRKQGMENGNGKKGKDGGRIIYVSSVMATFALPFQAFYSASKSALNALALSLKNEVAPFGISVCVLMPGDVKTGFTDARKKELAGADIYTHLQDSVAQMEHDEQHGILPERMARKLYEMAEAKSPWLLSTVGWMYHAFLFLGKVLPATLAYKIVGKMY
ncbi:MAG: SDR family NAD(P)-dependent oxidoreductase [Prevotella sp.]|nr:SDR family NAD(P)-dependent oxidoreductase [Candidatus Prevotella equi]